jgi:hypothetical protein
VAERYMLAEDVEPLVAKAKSEATAKQFAH